MAIDGGRGLREGKIMQSALNPGWRLIGLLLATHALDTHAAAAGTETVYQRTQGDGGVTLTNLPTGEGELVLVTGVARAGAAGTTGQTPGAPAPASVPARVVEMPPSIEARSGPLLDAQAASSLALTQAQQAQDSIVSAGGVQARLLNLYQASLNAFQARRKAP